MAGEVALANLLDLVATTMPKYPDSKFRNGLIRQSYIFGSMFKALKPKAATGTKLVFVSLLKGTSGTGDAADGGAGRYGSYETLGSSARESAVQGEVPWGYYQNYWAVSSQELRHNSGKEGFIDIHEVKLEECLTRMANVLENDFWDPDAYTHEGTAKPAILGPPYWVTDDGYHVNDAAGASGTEVGGINPADTDYNDDAGTGRWLNKFKNETDANAILDEMDNMFIDTKFKTPPNVKLNTEGKYTKYRIVMDVTTYKLYKKLQKRLRDNVGADLSSGRPVFNNIEVEPAHDMVARSDGFYQMYFLNMDTWRAYVDTANNMRRTSPFTPDNQDAKVQRIFFWPCIVCDDRRANGKIFGYGATLTE